MKIERKELLKYDHRYIYKIGYNKNIRMMSYFGTSRTDKTSVRWLTVMIPDIYTDIYKRLITLTFGDKK